MAFLRQIPSRMAQRARERALMSEMSAMTDAELRDFNLSRVRLAEMARLDARRA